MRKTSAQTHAPQQSAKRTPAGVARWYDILDRLQRADRPQTASPPDHRDWSPLRTVAATIEQALHAALRDSDWAQSGLPEALQRALTLAAASDLDGARTAALQLLDFHRIVSRNSSATASDHNRLSSGGHSRSSPTHPAQGSDASSSRVFDDSDDKGRPALPATTSRPVSDAAPPAVVRSANDPQSKGVLRQEDLLCGQGDRIRVDNPVLRSALTRQPMARDTARHEADPQSSAPVPLLRSQPLQPVTTHPTPANAPQPHLRRAAPKLHQPPPHLPGDLPPSAVTAPASRPATPPAQLVTIQLAPAPCLPLITTRTPAKPYTQLHGQSAPQPTPLAPSGPVSAAPASPSTGHVSSTAPTKALPHRHGAHDPATPPAKQPAPALSCGKPPRSSSAPSLWPSAGGSAAAAATSPGSSTDYAAPLLSSQVSSRAEAGETASSALAAEPEHRVPPKKRKRKWAPSLPTSHEAASPRDAARPPDPAAAPAKAPRTQTASGPSISRASSGELTVLRSHPAPPALPSPSGSASANSLLYSLNAVDWLGVIQRLVAPQHLAELASLAKSVSTEPSIDMSPTAAAAATTSDAVAVARPAAIGNPSPFRARAEQPLRRFSEQPPARRTPAELEMLPSVGSTDQSDLPPPATDKAADLHRLQLELHHTSNHAAAAAAAAEGAKQWGKPDKAADLHCLQLELHHSSNQAAAAAAAAEGAKQWGKPDLPSSRAASAAAPGFAQTVAEALARNPVQDADADEQGTAGEAGHAVSQGPGDEQGDAGGSHTAPCRWAGRVKHRLGQSTVELCQLGALVPQDLLEQLPPTLFVSELRSRTDVKLVNHALMPCQVHGLTDKQRHKLHMLASLRLVADCQLQHCRIVLVPQLDSGGCFRMVGFLMRGPS